jgi:protein-disulfide isomerase
MEPCVTARFFRTAALGLILAVTSVMIAMAADGPAPGQAEQLRIDKAIESYTAKQKMDREQAADQVVANRMASLLTDPATLVLGNPQGDVTIIEFFDYTCPFCKAVEPRLRQLLAADKKVKLVVKEFPILHPVSLVATKAALASAKQGKYALYHQKMMDFRGELTEEAIFDMAKDVGLDVQRLRRDMNAPEIADAIVLNFNLARALRIFDTPTFIIGNHLVTEASGKIDFPREVAALRAKH